MGEQKSFLLYKRYRDQINQLSNEQAGQLMKAIFDYTTESIEPDFDDLALSILFGIIKTDIDSDASRFEEVCEKRSEAGKKGGRPRKETEIKEPIALNEDEEKAKKPNAFFEKQTKAKKANTNNNTNNNTDINNIKNNMANELAEFASKSSPKSKDDELKNQFEELWSLYPRKERKADAQKAYLKYAKSHSSAFSEVLAGINAYANKIKRDGTEQQYIAQGGTWFSQQRWKDDYSSGNAPKVTPMKHPTRMYSSENRNLDFLTR